MSWTIVTLNTWKCDGDYPRRLPAMARAVAAARPDVACLQEVLRVPGGPDTAATLAESAGLAAHVSDARVKVRAVAGREVMCASGLALLGPEAVRVARLNLPADLVLDGERLAQLAHVEGGALGPLLVVNLHLTHPAGQAAMRAEEMAVILAAVEASGMARAVLAGDFNDSLGSPALGLPFTMPGWRCRDAVAAAGVERFATAPEGDAAIDHVLLLERLDVAPLRVLAAGPVGERADGHAGVMPSDHVGLRVVLTPT